MGVVTIIASISSIALTVLATVGWVVFIGGFGAFNTESRFFEQISSLSPERRELAFFPYNSHYIVAVLSPILFIAMIVTSILMMVLKNKWAPYITAIMSVPILILAAFVMISSGVVLHIYSLAITFIRVGLITPTPQGQGLLSASYAMFAGSLLENLFLVGALIAAFVGAILAAKDQGKSVD